MVLQIKAESRIENPRQYATHTIEELRNLLIAGGSAHRDPVRDHFYKLEGILETYYIYISPITGNVVLLARWTRQPQDCYREAEHLVA